MAERLPQVLGDELRRERKRHGWTRKDLHARLAWEVTIPTLATYELGTRTLSVERLVDLAEALGVSALDVLARTLARVGKVGQVNRLEIDLRKIARDRTTELAPLRRWAELRLRQARPGEPTSARLDQPTLFALAEICGLGADELIAHLHHYTA